MYPVQIYSVTNVNSAVFKTQLRRVTTGALVLRIHICGECEPGRAPSYYLQKGKDIVRHICPPYKP